MSQALSHDEAEIDLYEALQEEGGTATYIDITDGVYDDVTGETSPSIETPYTISVLPLEAKQEWLSSGLVVSTNVIFMASTKELRDLGITIEIGEKITFNNVTYTYLADIPYLAGKGAFGHRLVCNVG